VRLKKFIPPMSIVLFLVLALAGTYYVRLRILERHMAVAMEMNDGTAFTELAHSFPCPVDVRDKEGRTPFHMAVERGDRALVELLLRKGADVNAKDKDGRTPLFLAAEYGYEEITELLVAKGADMHVMFLDGWTPLHGATALGHKELVKFLITKGADANAKDSDGTTPLHVAVSKEVAELLIARGADVHAKTSTGETPLHDAASDGHKEVAELLIAKGADINATDKDGWTPLHLATRGTRKEVIQLLIAQGADIHARDNKGETALQLAIDNGNYASAEVLWKAEAEKLPGGMIERSSERVPMRLPEKPPIAKDPTELLRALAEVVKDEKTPADKGLAALAAIAELDMKGECAAKVLAAMKDGRMVEALGQEYRWDQATADVLRYLVSHAQGEKELEGIAELLLGKERQLAAFFRTIDYEMPMGSQAQLYGILLSRGGGNRYYGSILARAAYYYGGEGIRETFEKIAHDPGASEAVRLDAALAWAARCTREDYDRVYALMREVEPWQTHPGARVLEVLGMLDWKRAREEFKGIYEDSRKKPATEDGNPGRVEGRSKRPETVSEAPAGEPPRRALYHGVGMPLQTFGDEREVRETMTGLVEWLRAKGKATTQDREVLEQTGWREAGGMLEELEVDSAWNALEVYFKMGADPEEFVKRKIEKGTAEEAVKVSGEWQWKFMPERLAKKYGKDFVERALAVLDKYGDGRGDRGDTEKVAAYDAFVTLCKVAPEKAAGTMGQYARWRPGQASACAMKGQAQKAFVEAIRGELGKTEELDEWDEYNLSDALMRASGQEGVEFVQKLYGETRSHKKRLRLLGAIRRHDGAFANRELTWMLKEEKGAGDGLEVARQLLTSRTAPDEEQRGLAEGPMLEALRNTAGAPRLEYAIFLGMLGNAEGREVYESFIRGEWRPVTNYWAGFHDLSLMANFGEEPRAERARGMLLAAMTRHPDPNVRAWAVRLVREAAGSGPGRGTGGANSPRGRFELTEAVMGQLGPEQDWRVRVQAGWTLRWALREVNPEWDYDAFWEPKKLEAAATELQKWWEAKNAGLRWEAGDGIYGPEGRFVWER